MRPSCSIYRWLMTATATLAAVVILGIVLSCSMARNSSPVSAERDLGIRPYVQRVSYQGGGPSLAGGVGWINSSPIRLEDLRGKIVLLDFWTYCCINCHHVLPEL